MKLSITEAFKIPTVREEKYIQDGHISRYTRVVEMKEKFYEFNYSYSDWSGYLEKEVELWEVEQVETVVTKYIRTAPANNKTVSSSQGDSAKIQTYVDRFLSWSLPKDFNPDCGISFDGRKDDEWNKNKTWPVGTNLFTAEQAKQMLEYVLSPTEHQKS